MRAACVLVCCLAWTAFGVPLGNSDAAARLLDVRAKAFQNMLQSEQAVLPDGEDSDNEPVVESNLIQQEDNTMATQDVSLPSPSPSPATPAALRNEIVMPKRLAKTVDARDDMKPGKSDPFDDDCDSPQIGESEINPQGEVVVNMNSPHTGANMNSSEAQNMKEQSLASREVLIDDTNNLHVTTQQDDPAAFSGTPIQHPSERAKPLEFDAAFRSERLPVPNADVAKKSKCSRYLNGHDVPDALHALDDDCGMPEPEIPCETPGNSTKCITRIQIAPPRIPEAELMPPVPAPEYHVDYSHLFTNLSVEFVDFGVTKQVQNFHLGEPVGRAVEQAGEEFGVSAWQIQLVRSGGVDIRSDITLENVIDRQQLIVYLTCTQKRFLPQLIMTIPACEDLTVKHMVAKVEVPAFHAIYAIHVLSTERVGAVIDKSPIDMSKVETITYDGQNVTMDMALEDLYFRNNSAFVVYPLEPCPSHTPSPSNTPTATSSSSPTPSRSPFPSPSSSPLPIKHKVRKLGAYDAYRHCKNARGEKLQVPPPDALGLDATAVDPLGKASNSSFECEMSEMTEPEEVDLGFVNATRPPDRAPKLNDTMRAPMRRPAKILVVFEGRKFPVLVKPIAKGIDIFDAVTRVSGTPHEHLVAQFMNRPINHYTPLKPFGFLDGDQVLVLSAKEPSQAAAPTPQPIAVVE